ncbi:hypothetical protein A2Z33_02410 [Candidatus Gottesmanbacteria bacterium RBG_16_52_11]|uniref:HTH cro/C1-type domain-containing protein n=1 Tax=Candidatus Gottesmanbacteria bacterium RBG_16_52_11 TaxID=1798374 RepID=A0A1F5YMK3_9BACT|nr:MAG: hypothetical protein A2Z33_02410 [Candidatus Gottesmanbacteria bacterium RBG_16_52_11]
MMTVGSMLRSARIARKLSIEDVEKATRIRKKFLTAIEADDFTSIPSPAYAKGFIRNYSDFVGLDQSRVLAFFRRQTMEAPKSTLLPKGMAEPLNASVIRLTPGRFLMLVILGFAAAFIAYFGLQVRRIQHPPVLSVESPADGIIISDRRIDVLGRTDPDATVSVNGIGILVRSDGKFFDQVSLEPGSNLITISSTSRFGKSVTETLTVTVMPQ